MATKVENKVTRKNVNSVISSVYSVNFSTLSGCVKTFIDAMKVASKTEVGELCTASDLDTKTALKVISFCRDRSRVMRACLDVMPNIDGTICEYKAISKQYLQKDKTEKSFDNTNDLKGEMLLGKTYKPYGMGKTVVELLPTDVNYILKETDICSTTYAPFAVKSHTVKKVVRAVVDYIVYCEKNGINWTKKDK